MPNITTPELHYAYPSNTEGIFVFPFILQYDQAVQSPSTQLAYEIQIDSAKTFATPNLMYYSNTSAGIVNFQDGDLGKAFEITMPRRQRSGQQTWYYRVRINKSPFVSDWTDPLTLTIREDYSYDILTNMDNNLADKNVYAKEGKSSNVHTLFRAFAREMDALKLEYNQTQSDNYLRDVRDSHISDNFGKMVGLVRGGSQEAADYKLQVYQLWDAFTIYPGIEQGIIDVVTTFTGEEPDITDHSDQYGWLLGYHYIYDPTYPPTDPVNPISPIITLYSRRTKGFGWDLEIWNSWGFTLDTTTLEDMIHRIKPAHTKVTITYKDQKHTSETYNIAADWNRCTLSNTEVFGNWVILSSGQNSGTVTTPTIDCTADVNTWSYLYATIASYGGTLTFELRSSTDDINWSSWETVTNNRLPVTTPIRRYIQWRVTFSRTAGAASPVLEVLRFDYNRE